MNVRRHNHLRLAGLTAIVCLAWICLGSARALAQGAPQWTVTAFSEPTNFTPGDESGKDSYIIVVRNTGDAPSDGSTVDIVDTLPAGLSLNAAGASGADLLTGNAVSCAGTSCSYSGEVAVDDELKITIPVNVSLLAPISVTNTVSVSGGGAGQAGVSNPTAISTAAPGYGIAPGTFSEAVSDAQAGAHADLTTTFAFNNDAGHGTFGNLKDTIVDLPVGFAGDPRAVPTCTAAQLSPEHGAAECPVDSQVGEITLRLGFPGLGLLFVTSPVYNMQVQPGEVTRLGFNAIIATTDISITVRPDDYGLRATTHNIFSSAPLIGASLTIWGVPGDHSHDPWRNTTCIGGVFGGETKCTYGFGGSQSPGASSSEGPVPFLSNPTQCTTTPLAAMLAANSWQQREDLQSTAPSDLGPMTGCNRMPFEPNVSIVTTTNSAASPTGLVLGLNLPQTYGNPGALATAALKKTVVTLPEGITVNPSAGAGLGVCTPAQLGAETATSQPDAGCPNNSELGTITVHTPVLEEPAIGHVYLAQPYNNPFDSLLGIYVVARIPARGVIVKSSGEVIPNPVTGQLVTVFDNLPPLPYDQFSFAFNQGQSSPLVSPPACGSYTANVALDSWAEPSTTLAESSTFPITAGVGGGACPAGGEPPFAPQAISGTEDNDAGAYSAFYLRVLRKDGEQEITKFSTVLPPGLSGNLSGIPFCSDSQIEVARTKAGAQELTEPSCPAASEIGHTLVGAGVGGVLAQAPGKVYLAGPYHGSALSIVSITSATVGPFDLGTVVIRFALRINPVTAQVEIDSTSSDPIPHIIDGIVVHVRDIRVYVDRSKFILNPTNCSRMAITNTIAGAGADFTTTADDVSATLTTPFQAADCSSLAFKPAFKVSTSGKPSRANGASLTARLSYPNAPLGSQANIAKVKVDLPKQLPSYLKTLQKACLSAVFERNPAACPAGSVVGHATATTPIVPVPLSGPAYFVSYGGAKFPELIIVLSGYGITVDLHGETFINKAGITSSTFNTVPDVPIGAFELVLPQGPNHALAANGNLCASPLKMPTVFTAQNGDVIRQSTPIAVTGCARHTAKVRHKHGRRKSGKRGKR